MYLISSKAVVHQATNEAGMTTCGILLKANYTYRQSIPLYVRVRGACVVEPRKCKVCFSE